MNDFSAAMEAVDRLAESPTEFCQPFLAAFPSQVTTRLVERTLTLNKGTNPGS
jgi:hypothetical protein